MDKKIKVGISSCLLGQKVRFDGGHKKSDYCEKELSHYFDFYPLCPEMAVGLGSPRPAIRQVIRENGIRIEASNGSFDITQSLLTYSEQTVSKLNFISGYILCAKSPTCGMERVRVYGANNEGSSKDGVGVFANALMQAHPLLPVEEDGRLNDPVLRENFVLRVFAYHHWQKLNQSGLTAQGLIEFHSQYKYLLMAHSVEAYKQSGRLLANLKGKSINEIGAQYIGCLMLGLCRKANRKSHTNVLNHLQGYFKDHLTPDQKAELTETIEQYRLGTLPLLAPITLIRHYLRQYPDPYLANQFYLDPHPSQLALRYGL